MEVTVPLFAKDVSSGSPLEDIREIYSQKYNSEIVKYSPLDDGDGMISSAKLSGKDSMEISVFGNSERIILTARYDNLGKGASGAAIENMNIALGFSKTAGLEL
jgi:N-acetyl-gamma-glutamyl-phosphate reductase